MKELELSARLQELAKQVPQGAKLGDIGTDHAYLPVWLIRQGIITGAVAADLREGPLAHGMEIARLWGVQDRISFRCCDGLEGISPHEVDTVVIAGMGGETISYILQECSWGKELGLLYLLQPMSTVPELRRFLCREGYAICEETLVMDEGKIYVIMKATPGETTAYTLGEVWLGKQYRESAAPLRLQYIEDMIHRRTLALEGMRQAAQPDMALIEETELLLQQMNQMREEWLSWQR